jgi:hypothetical protein
VRKKYGFQSIEKNILGVNSNSLEGIGVEERMLWMKKRIPVIIGIHFSTAIHG